MPNKQGDFIWYELITNNADAAQDFYGKILGWTFQNMQMKDRDYRTFSANGAGIGGVMALSSEMTNGGMRPSWMGYVAVDDVDASVQSIMNAGGSVHMKPFDIPGVGRIAFVADPQGVMLYIMRPKPPADNPDATSSAFTPTEALDGHCAWNELATNDPDAAVDFYTGQFGWRQEGEMDMGPMGTYKFFYHGPDMIAGLMKKADEMPVSAWSYYFRVPDIDAAVETVKAIGGQIMQEPMEIPGGDFAMNGMDPQGAAFALVGPRK